MDGPSKYLLWCEGPLGQKRKDGLRERSVSEVQRYSLRNGKPATIMSFVPIKPSRSIVGLCEFITHRLKHRHPHSYLHYLFTMALSPITMLVGLMAAFFSWTSTAQSQPLTGNQIITGLGRSCLSYQDFTVSSSQCDPSIAYYFKSPQTSLVDHLVPPVIKVRKGSLVVDVLNHHLCFADRELF